MSKTIVTLQKEGHPHFIMDKNSSVFVKNEFSIRPRKKLKKCFFLYLIGTCVCTHTRVTERARERGRERRWRQEERERLKGKCTVANSSGLSEEQAAVVMR